MIVYEKHGNLKITLGKGEDPNKKKINTFFKYGYWILNYSHLTIIPKNATMHALSGQIGVGVSGELPSSLSEQVKNTLKNIQFILESEGLTQTMW